MADFWDFNCPQFVDFTTPVDDEDNADDWFDMDHETPEIFYTPVVDRKSRGEPKRVLSEVVLSTNNIRQEYSGGKSNAKHKQSMGPSRVPATTDENNPPEKKTGNSRSASLSSRVSKYTSKLRRSCVEVGAGEAASVENACLDNIKIKPGVLDMPAGSTVGCNANNKIAKYTPRRSKYKEVGAGEAMPCTEVVPISPNETGNSSAQSSASHVDDINVSVSSTSFVAKVKGVKRLSSTPKPGAVPKQRSSGKKGSSKTKRRSLSRAASFTSALRRSPRILLDKLTGGSRSKPTTPCSAGAATDKPVYNLGQRIRRSWSKSSPAEGKATSRPAKLSYNKLKKLEAETSSVVDVRQQLAHRRKNATLASKAVIPLKAVASNNPAKTCATQGESVREFASTLRKFSEEPVNAAPRASITKPMPFNLSQPKKRKHEEGGAFHSMAEQVKAFQTKTPQRFRTRSRNASSSVTSSPEGAKSPKVTIPQTPKLMSRYRTRPVTALSKEQLEQQELEHIQKNQFKAHPVNLRAIQQPQLIDVKSKTPTKLEPFKLTCPQKLHASLNNVSTEKYEFRARPVPPGLFDGPKVSAQNKVALDTTTKSSPFPWNGRLRRRSKSFSEKSESLRPKVMKAIPVPHSGVPFKIKLDKKQTMVEPFSFDDLDRKRMAQKEIKIKELIEQECKVREFHAQPLPNLQPSGIPEKQPRPPTEIQPFHFDQNDVAQMRVEKWKREMEEELKRQKELASFKAGPNKVIYEDPFIPEKSSRPLTVVADIELNTQRRAIDREEFDQYLKYKESEMEALRLQREAEAEERERQLIAKIRQEAVHKANPVRNYKPVDIRPSNMPLTVPQSPCFIAKSSKPGP